MTVSEAPACAAEHAPHTEAALYPPVKALLEAQGYTVKGEVGPADLMACRGAEPPLFVELKRGFSLTLFHQAADRLRLSDAVYVAVPEGRGRRWQAALRANGGLCRRLGLGLILVRLDPAPALATVAFDPGPYRPRPATARKERLLREFARREGDPTAGGLPSRAGRITAYRQEAIRIAGHLARHGPTKGAEVAEATGVPRATRMMADNHYGWFERLRPGIYGLTPRGAEATAALVAADSHSGQNAVSPR